MTTNEKRLLKDLPFENLVAGTVLIRRNSSYHITTFNTHYSGGGTSSGPTTVLDKTEKELIDTIWDNENWFEEATLKHIDIVLGKSEIKLRFKPLSAEKAETLAKGIQCVLKHMGDGSYTWSEFAEITSSIKNN